jgi:prepilin-type N-terminal cleavage/methylation domain-containing protein
MKNQNGFSLIELLIVVTTLGIVLAIASPNFINSQRAANESSAVSSLRGIHTSQVAYYSTDGNSNFGTRSQLASAKLIDGVLAGGTKSRYNFSSITVVAKTASLPSYYFATATPSITSGPFQTGFNSYAIHEAGVVFRRVGTTAPTINATSRVFTTGSAIN